MHFFFPNLKPGNKVILALSGGPDSVCLLDLMSKKKFEIIVAHLHHGLRGRAANRDQRFCNKLAKKYGLVFETEKADVKSFAKTHKLSIEEAARKLRYDFLRQIKQKHQAKFILTAHNLDDQAETIFMNFVRGSGVRGLQGMPLLNEDILRPLLKISKQDILSYLKKNKLKFCSDSSNKDKSFTRNKFRLDILPQLKQVNPNLSETLAKNSLIFRDLEAFLNKQAQAFIKKHYKNDSFPIKEFLKLDITIQRQIVKLIYKKFCGDLKNLSFTKTEKALELIYNKKTSKQFKLSEKLTFRINYAKVDCVLKTLPKRSSSKKKLNINGKTSFFEKEIEAKKVKKIGKLSKEVAYLNYERTGPLYIRSLKRGDRFQPSGFKGSKKLQDFLIDKKISVFERSLIPIVVNSKDQIIWIAGHRVSEKFKAHSDSQNIIKLKLLTINPS